MEQLDADTTMFTGVHSEPVACGNSCEALELLRRSVELVDKVENDAASLSDVSEAISSLRAVRAYLEAATRSEFHAS